MKCYYYLTSTLDSVRKITEDLHNAGVDDWFIHTMCKDEAGLKRDKIHSSNYLEQLDFLRFVLLGSVAGSIFGMAIAAVFKSADLFGQGIPNSAYYAIVLFALMFGAWEGGLAGVALENRKIRPFHDDLEAGAYLLLIYAKNQFENPVIKTMDLKHPEAEWVAVDSGFYNPLSKLKRIEPGRSSTKAF